MQQIMSRTYVYCSPNQVNFATVFVAMICLKSDCNFFLHNYIEDTG